MKNSKRKRSAPHKTTKPATPITAFFKPVPPTTTVFIPFTVPTPNHLYYLSTSINLTSLNVFNHPTTSSIKPLLPIRSSSTNNATNLTLIHLPYFGAAHQH